MSARYGGARVRRGLANFLVGKGVSSVAGFCSMVLVVRLLPLEAFAVYSVLVALVQLFTAVSSLGLTHALLRYVPELYAAHYRVALRQFVFGSLAVRTLVLLVAAAATYALSDRLAPLIGIGNTLPAFEAFLLVVVLRSTSHFLVQILESTLHQGSAQFGYSLAAVARLAGMLYLLARGEATLTEVILVEAVSEGLSMLAMLASVISVAGSQVAGPDAPGDDATWLRTRMPQIARFAISGYVQHLAILPFGSNMNRLVGGRLLANVAMANFGFAQSLYEYLKRYMPAQLLAGLIRPVLLARYAETGNFAAAAALCERVFQVNLLLIGMVVVFLASGGEETLVLMSGGKYGGQALLVLGWLMLVLLLETHRLQLEILVQTVERYAIMIPSNFLLALSVLPAIALAPTMGAVAFPVANALGLLIANAWVRHRLARDGHVYRHRWLVSLRVTAAVAVAGTLGVLLKLAGIHWLVAAALSCGIYGIASWWLCRTDMRSLVRDLVSTNS